MKRALLKFYDKGIECTVHFKYKQGNSDELIERIAFAKLKREAPHISQLKNHTIITL